MIGYRIRFVVSAVVGSCDALIADNSSQREREKEQGTVANGNDNGHTWKPLNHRHQFCFSLNYREQHICSHLCASETKTCSAAVRQFITFNYISFTISNFRRSHRMKKSHVFLWFPIFGSEFKPKLTRSTSRDRRPKERWMKSRDGYLEIKRQTQRWRRSKILKQKK